jgi:hypothetical protein
METFGALIEGLNGEVEIIVRGIEEPVPEPKNYDAYARYEAPLFPKPKSATSQDTLVLRPPLYMPPPSST